MKKLRFGIVGGAAGIAKSHIDAIRKTSNCELLALTDVAQDKCRERAQQENLRFFATYDQMLASPDITAISICAPHPFHCELAVKALKAGKHVITEKPMCVTVSEADRMVRAAARSKGKLGVVYQQRYRADVQKAKELMDSGALGPLYRTLMIVGWYRTQAYYNSGGWRATWKGEGGGVLLNQAPHNLDLFVWLAGMPQRVCAWTPTLLHDIEVEDCASALLGYKNGAQGYLHTSTIEAPGYERYEFCGDKGRLILAKGVSFEKLVQPISDHCRTSAEMWASPKHETQQFELSPSEANHVRVFREFADAVLAGQEPPVNAVEGRKCIELTNALILSHFEKRPVELPIKRAEYDRLLASLCRKSKPRK